MQQLLRRVFDEPKGWLRFEAALVAPSSWADQADTLRGRRHLPNLDALRGIAAIFVLFFHLGQVADISGLAVSGALAVDFFFMLSGFVIGLSYEKRLAGEMAIGDFLWRRAERLYPTILVGLVLGFATLWLGWGWAGFAPMMLLNFLLLPAGVFGRLGVFPLNTPVWSILFESMINAIHALILPFLGRRLLPAVIALCAALMVAASIRTGTTVLGWTATRWTSIAFWGGLPRAGFGYFLGVAAHRLWRSGWLKRGIAPFWLSWLALAIVLVLPDRFGIWQPLAMILFVLPAILTIGADVALAPGAERLAKWLGGISYPLYAIHWPLLFVCHRLAEPLHLGQPAKLFYWALCAAAIIAAARMIQIHYETPVLGRLRAWRERGKPAIGARLLADA